MSAHDLTLLRTSQALHNGVNSYMSRNPGPTRNRWAESLHWSSLRGRVFVFTGFVIVLLLIILLGALDVVRHTQTVLVRSTMYHDGVLARSLARAYETRADHAGGLNDAPFSTRSVLSQSHDWLSGLTAQELADNEGVEGGFYRAADHSLGGYAFPTHQAMSELSEQDMISIAALSDRAWKRGRLERLRLPSETNITLATAQPVCESSPCKDDRVGTAWIVERLPSPGLDRKRAMFGIGTAFVIIAMLLVALAYSVLTSVEMSTATVLKRLTGMGSELGTAPLHGHSVFHLAEFQRMLDGLDQLATTLQSQMERERGMAEKLHHSERLAAIGRLAAVVAHELRSPLATIRLRTEMADSVSVSPAVKNHCGIILSETGRLNAIIERLLTFARPLNLTLRPIDLAQTCSETMQRWQDHLPGITLVASCNEDAPLLCDGDESRLRQALDNVIENAAHMLRDKMVLEPFIHLVSRRQDHHAVLCVTDNGVGFTPEALQRGTEAFFTTRADGTGLGLAVAQEIIEAHGGKLTLENLEASGAVVTITLPLKLGTHKG